MYTEDYREYEIEGESDQGHDHNKLNYWFVMFYILKKLARMATIVALFLFILNKNNPIFGNLVFGVGILNILDSIVELVSCSHEHKYFNDGNDGNKINCKLRIILSLLRFVASLQILGNSCGLSILHLNNFSLLSIILALYLAYNVLNCIQKGRKSPISALNFKVGYTFALALFAVACPFVSPSESLCLLSVSLVLFAFNIITDVLNRATERKLCSKDSVHQCANKCFFSIDGDPQCVKLHYM